MTDETGDSKRPDIWPTRPARFGAQKYDVLRQAEETAKQAIQGETTKAQNLFTMSISATNSKGDHMEPNPHFLIDLIFKPNKQGLRLRPEETQLLLAHFSEILKQIEGEQLTVSLEVAANPVNHA